MKLSIVPKALCLFALVGTPLLAGVINGGFETGDLTGWTQFGDTSFTSVTSAGCPNGSPSTCTPNTGTFAAYFGNGSPGGISQAIATDLTTTYVVDFWVKLFGSGVAPGTPNEFQAIWDGNTLTDIVNTADGNWRHLTFSGLSASSLSTTLTFNITDEVDWIGLDDITVSAAAAPEPATMSLLGIGIAIAAALRRKSAIRG